MCAKKEDAFTELTGSAALDIDMLFGMMEMPAAVEPETTSDLTDKSNPTPENFEPPAKKEFGESQEAADATSAEIIDLFGETIKETAERQDAHLLEVLAEKPPRFSYAAIEEDITDSALTFEGLRERMAADLPELEDRGHVSWTVEYAGITEKVAKPASETIFAVKRRIEEEKKFQTSLKKQKQGDKEPICLVKPVVIAQKKGVMPAYKK